MNENLLKYRITPRIAEVGKEQVIEVEALDSSVTFFDDCEYMVKISSEDWISYTKEPYCMVSNRDSSYEFTSVPENGIIRFSYRFEFEGLWKIHIARKKSDKHIKEEFVKYWPWLTDTLFSGFDFNVYALNEDLYHKRPYKGDLHIHTYASDGGESPEMVAAQYRKFGYDFISITDHYKLKPSFDAIEKLSGIDMQFKIFPGEEVHPIVGSVFHMVNFNPKSSVNEIAFSNPDKVKEEVLSISKDIDAENEADKQELAWFKWMYDSIKKTGGIAIYPHPYWVCGDSLNLRTNISEKILKSGFCDAFEIMGGTDKNRNRMQVLLNYEMREDGFKYPIVASSDAHSSLVHNHLHFDQAWTVCFAESAEEIPDNILNNYSVAVDNFEVMDKNVYGSVRLANYTWFLIENYYENHDAICNAAGQAMLRYVLGDKTQKDLVCMLENEVKKFNDTFFGNNLN